MKTIFRLSNTTVPRRFATSCSLKENLPIREIGAHPWSSSAVPVASVRGNGRCRNGAKTGQLFPQVPILQDQLENAPISASLGEFSDLGPRDSFGFRGLGFRIWVRLAPCSAFRLPRLPFEALAKLGSAFDWSPIRRKSPWNSSPGFVLCKYRKKQKAAQFCTFLHNYAQFCTRVRR